LQKKYHLKRKEEKNTASFEREIFNKKRCWTKKQGKLGDGQPANQLASVLTSSKISGIYLFPPGLPLTKFRVRVSPSLEETPKHRLLPPPNPRPHAESRL
jgi:hypothetical protein